MNKKPITYHEEENIGYITLCSPPGNEMNSFFFNSLLAICEKHLLQTSLRGLIIQAEGRHFSSGAVVPELTATIQQDKKNRIPQQLQHNSRAFQLIRNFNKPVVALLKGICYGSGFELALCAHYRIATRNTRICLPECSFDLMPGLGGIFNTSQFLSSGRALEMILTGKTLDAEEAKAVGLIDNIVTKDTLYKTVLGYIE
jgi:enoyl-CoA hydratase/carnithine racemase